METNLLIIFHISSPKYCNPFKLLFRNFIDVDSQKKGYTYKLKLVISPFFPFVYFALNILSNSTQNGLLSAPLPRSVFLSDMLSLMDLVMKVWLC